MEVPVTIVSKIVRLAIQCAGETLTFASFANLAGFPFIHERCSAIVKANRDPFAARVIRTLKNASRFAVDIHFQIGDQNV